MTYKPHILVVNQRFLAHSNIDRKFPNSTILKTDKIRIYADVKILNYKKEVYNDDKLI